MPMLRIILCQFYLFCLIFFELLNDLIWVKLEIINAQLHVDFVVLQIKALSDVSEFLEHDFLLLIEIFSCLITHLLKVLILKFFFLKQRISENDRSAEVSSCTATIKFVFEK
jgi:hypothetical protein